MKLLVKVKPGSKENRIDCLGPSEFVIYTTANAEKGKANLAVIKMLARHLDVPQSAISIVVGHKTKNKIINLEF